MSDVKLETAAYSGHDVCEAFIRVLLDRLNDDPFVVDLHAAVDDWLEENARPDIALAAAEARGAERERSLIIAVLRGLSHGWAHQYAEMLEARGKATT